MVELEVPGRSGTPGVPRRRTRAASKILEDVQLAKLAIKHVKIAVAELSGVAAVR